MELSLEQIFGVGAFQDSSILKIQKSSLIGLTPTANNSAESLLVSILITALRHFSGYVEDSNGLPILDSSNQPILFDNSEAYELLKLINWNPFQFNRNNSPYIMNQIIIFVYAKV